MHIEQRMYAYHDADIVSNFCFVSVGYANASDELDYLTVSDSDTT